MSLPFSEEIKNIGDEMGVSMYQRFTLNEASLFLRCTKQIVTGLVKQHKINYIQITEKQIEIFGYQLLQYLLNQTSNHKTSATSKSSDKKPEIHKPKSRPDVDRIIRSKELQDITGLSRTTIWRLENKGEFPRRVPLGVNSVGWKLSDVKNWIDRDII